jgi:hypothetical protein
LDAQQSTTATDGRRAAAAARWRLSDGARLASGIKRETGSGAKSDGGAAGEVARVIGLGLQGLKGKKAVQGSRPIDQEDTWRPWMLRRTMKKTNWQQVGYVGCQGSVGLLYFSSFFFLLNLLLLFLQHSLRETRGGKGLEDFKQVPNILKSGIYLKTIYKDLQTL